VKISRILRGIHAREKVRFQAPSRNLRKYTTLCIETPVSTLARAMLNTNRKVAELKSIGGNMNENDESVGRASRGIVIEFQIDPIAWIVILPAALTDFLPHARETGSFLPQRRRLFCLDIPRSVRRCSRAISPGPMGHVHPACCLNTNGPVAPRQCSYQKTALGDQLFTGRDRSHE
jgi:hypothetical protein